MTVKLQTNISEAQELLESFGILHDTPLGKCFIA
jgi:hypothetical protein